MAETTGGRLISLEEMPTQTEADAIVVLNQNTLVPSNYLDLINAAYYLNSTASVMMGPIFKYSSVRVDLDLIDEFMNSPNHFVNSIKSCTASIQQFNSLYGCVFNGYHYNKCGGYKPTVTPRGTITTPYEFLRKMARSSEIIYENRLHTGYFVTKEEQTNENILSHFYECGCKDHLYEISSLHSDDKAMLMYNIGKLEMKLGIRC